MYGLHIFCIFCIFSAYSAYFLYIWRGGSSVAIARFMLRHPCFEYICSNGGRYISQEKIQIFLRKKYQTNKCVRYISPEKENYQANTKCVGKRRNTKQTNIASNRDERGILLLLMHWTLVIKFFSLLCWYDIIEMLIWPI